MVVLPRPTRPVLELATPHRDLPAWLNDEMSRGTPKQVWDVLVLVGLRLRHVPAIPQFVPGIAFEEQLPPLDPVREWLSTLQRHELEAIDQAARHRARALASELKSLRREYDLDSLVMHQAFRQFAKERDSLEVVRVLINWSTLTRSFDHSKAIRKLRSTAMERILKPEFEGLEALKRPRLSRFEPTELPDRLTAPLREFEGDCAKTDAELSSLVGRKLALTRLSAAFHAPSLESNCCFSVDSVSSPKKTLDVISLQEILLTVDTSMLAWIESLHRHPQIDDAWLRSVADVDPLAWWGRWSQSSDGSISPAREVVGWGDL